ncbi:MAG: restriction endonuclease subunit S [Flavobacterium sp.]|nr:MAG: restriction endonuclease subunit S [Flavobacterium sp.]
MKQGWEVKKLGEICDFQNGFAFKSKTYKEDGKPILRITNIQNQLLEINDLVYFHENDYKENFDRFKVYKDDLVIAMSGATTGKLGINKSDIVFYLNQRVGKFIPKENLSKTYLYYFLSTKVEESLRIAAGAAQPNLSTEQINNFEIPLSPLQEQQRIVAILDEAFTAIDKAKANIEQNLKNAKELFESELQRIFSEKGDGWEEKRLEEVVDENCNLSYGIVQPGDEFPDGLPVIRPTDLTQKLITTKGLKLIDPKLSEAYKRTLLKGGELLICVRGNTGVVSVATNELKGANVTRGIVPIVFNSELIFQDFGYYLLISSYFQKQIKEKTYGAALMQINIGDLRKVHSKYPSLKKQIEIVSKLDTLHEQTKKLEAVYAQKLQDLEELKKSVLQKAFSGEL